MTGELEAWYQVASHLRTTVRELKAKLTYCEFLEWVVYLERELIERLKDEHYFAQIAAEVKRSRVANPGKVLVKDLLITVKKEGQEAEPRQAMEDSKAAWMGSVGVKLKKRKK